MIMSVEGDGFPELVFRPYFTHSRALYYGEGCDCFGIEDQQRSQQQRIMSAARVAWACAAAMSEQIQTCSIRILLQHYIYMYYYKIGKRSLAVIVVTLLNLQENIFMKWLPFAG